MWMERYFGEHVRIPMMPKGVEHASVAGESTAAGGGENSDDAERR